MVRVAVILLLGALASGCSVRTRAQEPIERPTLEIPPPPPRVIEPAPLPEVSQAEPVFNDLPPPPPDPTLAKRSPRDRGPSREAKPEAKPAEVAPSEPIATSPPPTQGTPAAPVLRTPDSVDAAAAEKQVRETINRANAGLGAVDFQRLSEARKISYNEVKDLIAQAEKAIKDSNLELARGLASSAEKLALTLQNR
jgi:hypothetical protein